MFSPTLCTSFLSSMGTSSRVYKLGHRECGDLHGVTTFLCRLFAAFLIDQSLYGGTTVSSLRLFYYLPLAYDPANPGNPIYLELDESTPGQEHLSALLLHGPDPEGNRREADRKRKQEKRKDAAYASKEREYNAKAKIQKRKDNDADYAAKENEARQKKKE